MVGTNSATPETDLRAQRLRSWFVPDWLLVVAALASATWACVPSSMSADSSSLESIVFDAQMHDGQTAWFLDDTNVVHWSSGSAEGSTSFALALNEVPTDVQVFVHPDSLIEPLVQTIGVLNQAGAQRVRIAVCDKNPFSQGDGNG